MTFDWYCDTVWRFSIWNDILVDNLLFLTSFSVILILFIQSLWIVMSVFNYTCAITTVIMNCFPLIYKDSKVYFCHTFIDTLQLFCLSMPLFYPLFMWIFCIHRLHHSLITFLCFWWLCFIVCLLKGLFTFSFLHYQEKNMDMTSILEPLNLWILNPDLKFLPRSESFSSRRGGSYGHFPEQADKSPRGQVAVRDEQLSQTTPPLLLHPQERIQKAQHVFPSSFYWWIQQSSIRGRWVRFL